ncbi:MAG TPA: hypothetical protein VLI55_00765 [Bryobacteraceae bacterium]|nr:hypothetical protein [Bryobacteraceae bacterium]
MNRQERSCNPWSYSYRPNALTQRLDSEILRKAQVAARTLALAEAQTWIETELNGYKSGDSAPPDRLLTGRIVAWNPYHRWIPVIFQDSREAAYLSKCFVGQPVGELEGLVKHGKTTLQFPFSSETELRSMKGLDAPLQPTRHLSRSSVSGILDAVGNMVLEWCLQLERNGILGEGLVFSGKEKEASAHSNYTINYNTQSLTPKSSNVAHTRCKL